MQPTRFSLILCVLVLFHATLSFSALSQTLNTFAPILDNTFIECVSQPDGRLILSGFFTKADAAPHINIVRTNPDGTVDHTFNAATDQASYALLVQPDGKILIGGWFKVVNGVPKKYLARLNPDGTLDQTFNLEANNAVFALARQSDGKVLIGGSFTEIDGQQKRSIARINLDGTLDENFNATANEIITCIAVDSMDRILVSGNLTLLNGVPKSHIGRLNSDGTLDESFEIVANGNISSIAVQPDGRILLIGGFTTLSGVPHNRVGRVYESGLVDNSFDSSVNATIQSVALQANGKLIIGGVFTNVNGQRSDYIARLNTNGTKDETFSVALDGTVNSVFVQGDAQIILGGNFKKVNGEKREYVARINNTEAATEVLTFENNEISWERAGGAPEISQPVFGYTTDPEGLIWTDLGVGQWQSGKWQLTNVNLPTNAVLRVQGFVTGGQGSGSIGMIESRSGSPTILLQPPDAVVIATKTALMSVTASGAPPLSYRWLKNGALLTGLDAETATMRITNAFGTDNGDYGVVISNAFGSITSSIANLTVLDPYILTHPRNVITNRGLSAKLQVGVLGTPPFSYQWFKEGSRLGGATENPLTLTNLQESDIGFYHVVVSNSVASATSAVASVGVNLSFPDTWNPTFNGTIYAMAVQADGKLLVGGAFTSVNGQTRNRLARFDSDGTLDSHFTPTITDSVRSICLQPDGKILIGGMFVTVNSQSRSRIARLNQNGMLDTNFTASATGMGRFNQVVNAVVLQTDGKILVAGDFATLNNQTCRGLGRLNPDGTLDTTFVSLGNPAIDSIALQNDGKILLGGTLGEASHSHNCLARLNEDGTLDTTFTPGGIGAAVYTVAILPTGRILVGGMFDKQNGSSGLRCLLPDGTAAPDFAIPFSGTVRSISIQTDGKILFAGAVTNLFSGMTNYVGRLHSEGSVDLSFNPSPKANVFGVMVEPGGQILVGGDFKSIAGQSRTGLARLNSTDNPEEQLLFDGAKIEWQRGGGLPEFWRTTFEVSEDGHGWSELGSGTYATNSWLVAGLEFSDSTSIKARGFVASAFANASGFMVERTIGRPVIIREPTSNTNTPGTSATFFVSVEGLQPISFQWLKNGIPLTDTISISGTLSNTLILSQVMGGNSGDYNVIVSNSFGSVTSLVATLTVFDPIITAHPTNQILNAGQHATFRVTAMGTAPRYQWRKDGEPLPGATQSILTVANVQRTDIGSYDAIVSNAFGAVTSQVARLLVNLATVDALSHTMFGDVFAVAVQPDGKILIGGNFTSISGNSRSRIARLNENGSLDATAGWSASHSVFNLTVRNDGKVLAGGWFNSLGGQPRIHLGLFHPNGTLDTNFNASATGGVVFPGVYSMVIQPDERIIVGGDYRSLSGHSTTNIGRIMPDGTSDTNFTATANDVVYPVALQPDGKVLVAGAFTTLNGAPRKHIGRLLSDGSLDPEFSPTVSSTVLSLGVQPDGKILVVGGFTNLCGSNRNRIGRLNPDGSLDQTFDPNANDVIRSLAIQTDGKILIGGDFTQISGQVRSNLARLNPDGTLDETFNIQIASTFFGPSVLHAVYLQDDGKVLLSGSFTSVGGQPRHRIARIVNTEPAEQVLRIVDNSLFWDRTGTSPEVWRTSFEISNDANSWTYLGSGERIAGGWQINDLQAAPASFIRARGYVLGGRYNSSSGFIESIFQLPPRTLPFIVLDNEILAGFDTFGFQVNGDPGQSFVVEGSVDLLNWTPLQTNTLESEPVYFEDVNSTNDTRRFYRLKPTD